jgi:hypothetical protein
VDAKTKDILIRKRQEAAMFAILKAVLFLSKSRETGKCARNFPVFRTTGGSSRRRAEILLSVRLEPDDANDDKGMVLTLENITSEDGQVSGNGCRISVTDIDSNFILRAERSERTILKRLISRGYSPVVSAYHKSVKIQ